MDPVSLPTLRRCHGDEAEIPHELDSTADDLFPFFPPPDAASIAARAVALVRSGQDQLAARLVSSRSAGLLLQAALVPERAGFWEGASREWLATRAPPPPPDLRRVWIEVLMAMGRLDDATREILEWTKEIPGPEPTWLVLRACEIDRGSLCDTALDDAAARSRAPFLARLRALRAETLETTPNMRW